MAITLTIGNVDLMNGTGKLRAGGIRTAQESGGRTIETYDLRWDAANASTKKNENRINDTLKDAIEYASNPLYDTPIYITEHADGETSKRAVIFGGELRIDSQGSFDRLLNLGGQYGTLAIERGAWESLSSSSVMSALTMGGNTSVRTITGVTGSMDNRISRLQIDPTTTNATANPLTRGWVGVRRYYKGVTNFDPTWELELGTTGTDCNITSIASNTSPIGSSANNAVFCDFASDTDSAKRVSETLAQAYQTASGELITNGGFENGDYTNWTMTTAAGLGSADTHISSTAANVKSGTYGSFSILSTASFSTLTNNQTVTTGNAYNIEIYRKILVDTTSGANNSINGSFSWKNSTGTTLSTLAGFSNESPLTTGVWNKFSSIGVAPASAVTLSTFVQIAAGIDGTLRAAVDGYSVVNVPQKDWIGQYQVLARMKNSTSVGYNYAQIKYGHGGTTNKSQRKELKVNSLEFKYYPMGIVNFPPGRARSNDEAIRRLANLEVELWARRGTGSANMFFDKLKFVPSIHDLYANDIQVSQNATSTASFYAYTEIDGSRVVLSDSTDYTGIDTNIEVRMPNFVLPLGTSVLVAAFQRDDSHQLADNFEVTLERVARWRSRNDD